MEEQVQTANAQAPKSLAMKAQLERTHIEQAQTAKAQAPNSLAKKAQVEEQTRTAKAKAPNSSLASKAKADGVKTDC